MNGTESHRPIDNISIGIDVMPESDTNELDIDSEGEIPVLVIGGGDFDPLEEVNVKSLRFGSFEQVIYDTGAAPIRGGQIRDVDEDDENELLLFFSIQDAGFTPEDSMAYLFGQTHDGRNIIGHDEVSVVTTG
jgi:hypothetical protein